MAVFLFLAVSIFGSVHYYFYRRLVKNTGLTGRLRSIAKWIIVFLGIITFGSFPLSRTLPLPISRAVMLVPYVWMGMMVLLLICLALVDFGRLTAFLVGKATKRNPRDQAAKQRLFRITAAVSLVVTILATGASLVGGLSSPEVKRVQVRLDRLNPAFDGFKIVQITDLHIGPTLGREWFVDVVERVNRLNPDLVAITGDLVDGSVENLAFEVSPLENIRASKGAYFVTGNHEYFSGAEEWVEKIDELGIRVLQDEFVTVKGEEAAFVLAGINDFRGGHGGPEDTRDLSTILRGFDFDEGAEVILLLHNPRTFLDVNDSRVGLVLSGHTHGGQFWPFSFLVKIGHPYLSGMYAHGVRTKVYVNEGTGFWGPPMRLGTTAEIAEITLISGDSKQK